MRGERRAGSRLGGSRELKVEGEWPVRAGVESRAHTRVGTEGCEWGVREAGCGVAGAGVEGLGRVGNARGSRDENP